MRGEHPRRRVLVWAVAFASVPLMADCQPSAARTRTYYIAADTVAWNYAPQGRNLITGAAFSPAEQAWTRQGRGRLGPVYQKSQYRQYTDASFTMLLKRPASEGYLGLLGPVIRAQVGDTIRVVFKNNSPFPASVHPHGVFYTKANEGAPSDDGTTGKDKEDDLVEPGHTYTYTWQVPDRAGPGPRDPSSIAWLYHDHSLGMGVPGTQAGLIGPLVVTRAGSAGPEGRPAGVDREAFVLFTEFDENASPYLKRNIAWYAPGQHIDPGGSAFQESNRKSSINGYLFGNGPAGVTDTAPALVLAKGQRVRWYLFGLGGEKDLHTPHWHGNTVEVAGQRTDVVNLLPATMVTADMRPDDPGIWLLHCHVDDHMMAGMSTRYQVR